MLSSFLGPELCYDVLLHILDSLYRDFGTLYQCSLVNWVFNRAASSIMYARVKLPPPPPFMSIRDLKEKGDIPVG
jgi:hypothetical protein